MSQAQINRKKYGACCVVPHCSMRTRTNALSEVKTFLFPKDAERREAWTEAIGRDAWSPKAGSSQICSKHFIKGSPSQDPNDPDFVPSIFPPVGKSKRKPLKKSVQQQRRQKGGSQESNGASATLTLKEKLSAMDKRVDTFSKRRRKCDTSIYDDIESVWPHDEVDRSVGRPEGMLKLYEMSDDPDRSVFLDKLLDYHEGRGCPMYQCPMMSRQPIDLYRLYLVVKEKGGFVEVMKRKELWQEICVLVGLPGSSSSAYTLRKHYVKHLLPFECEFDRGGIDPHPHIIQMDKRGTNAAGNEDHTGTFAKKIKREKPGDSGSTSTTENAQDNVEMDNADDPPPLFTPLPPRFPNQEELVGKRSVDVNYFVSCLRRVNKHHDTLPCGLSDMIICEEKVKDGKHGIVFRCKRCKLSNFVWLEDPFATGRAATATNTQANKNGADDQMSYELYSKSRLELESKSHRQQQATSSQKLDSRFNITDYFLKNKPKTLPKMPIKRILPAQSQSPATVQSHGSPLIDPQVAPTFLARDGADSSLVEMNFCVEEQATEEDNTTPVPSTRITLPPRKSFKSRATSKSAITPDISSTDVLPVDLNLVKTEIDETSSDQLLPGTLSPETIVPETITPDISEALPVDLNLVKNEEMESDQSSGILLPGTIAPETITSDVSGALPVNLNLVKKEIESFEYSDAS